VRAWDAGVNCQTPLLTIRKHACTLTLSTAHQVYRKTPAKLHKLLPALATQAAHSSFFSSSFFSCFYV
jgi:hypothetical protein